MPKYLTITEASKDLPNIAAELVDDAIIITKYGKPVIVMVSYEHLESLLETFEILEERIFFSTSDKYRAR